MKKTYFAPAIETIDLNAPFLMQAASFATKETGTFYGQEGTLDNEDRVLSKEFSGNFWED